MRWTKINNIKAAEKRKTLVHQEVQRKSLFVAEGKQKGVGYTYTYSSLLYNLFVCDSNLMSY